MILKRFVIFLLFFLLLSDVALASDFAVAVKKSQTNHLYFRGILNPLKNILVTSPVDGRVVGRNFEYGQRTYKDDVLLTLDATDLSQTYRSSLSDYLQKKADLQTQKMKFTGDEELFKAGVIAKQDFDASRNSYASSLLSLAEAQFELEKVLRQANIDFVALEELTLQDVKKVSSALQKGFSQFPVRSPADGVILIPVTHDASGDKTMLNLGDSVKVSQALLSVGDLSGFSVNINVNELDISQIKKGLKVSVTGDAFPGVVLHGMISRVAVQANPRDEAADDEGLAMYAVTITIPEIPPPQREKILVGMTAKVDLAITKSAVVMIPIDAVVVKNSEATVMLVDKKTGKSREVVVETGETTATEIAITRGLSAGDTIRY